MPRKGKQMKEVNIFRGACKSLAIIVVATVVTLFGQFIARPMLLEHNALLKLPDPTVAIATNETGSWVGSGVDLGNGKVLTAAHVVTGKIIGRKRVWVWAQGGDRIQGEVLWMNSKYDVALVNVPGLKTRALPLSCQQVAVGTPIEVVGNPGVTDFIHTWGRVARTGLFLNGNETPVMLSDVSIAPGNSGGPVFTGTFYDRRLVGLVSAISSSTLDGESVYGTGIAHIVPGAVICGLLGRS